jgi:hypothetical protein
MHQKRTCKLAEQEGWSKFNYDTWRVKKVCKLLNKYTALSVEFQSLFETR